MSGNLVASYQARWLFVLFLFCWELSLRVLEFLLSCFQQEMPLVTAVYLFLSFL